MTAPNFLGEFNIGLNEQPTNIWEFFTFRNSRNGFLMKSPFYCAFLN